MCFHASITSKAQHLEERSSSVFVNTKVKSQFNEPHYHLNGFAHPNLPIVTQELPEKILPAVWGIAPPNINPEDLEAYYKKASKFGGGLNARSEKLDSHFLYKMAYKSQRCLIYVDAFFEPHHVKSKSYPYLVKRKDREMMALAGLYTRFENGLVTCTIITKPASNFLAEIHNKKKRQPTILNAEMEFKWISNDLDDHSIVEVINSDHGDDHIEAYPVSKKLQSPKEDSNRPEILEPFNYPELNALF
jgi:putative SOS response-associated peptidase YedK